MRVKGVPRSKAGEKGTRAPICVVSMCRPGQILKPFNDDDTTADFPLKLRSNVP
jgi:hypothetical protein